jgi:hypothetical protein
MKCSSCESENACNRRYCRSCGSKLGSTCQSCGFSNDDGDMFCGGCSVSLQSSKSLPVRKAIISKEPSGAKSKTVELSRIAPAFHRYTETEITELLGARKTVDRIASDKLLSQEELDGLFAVASPKRPEESEDLLRLEATQPDHAADHLGVRTEAGDPSLGVPSKRTRPRSKSKSKPRPGSAPEEAP